jgi:uncharacterized membrane protein YgcG
MKKVLNLLEQHVQWLAVGLGAAWVLWMAWSYWVKSPSAVVVNGTLTSPGRVDEIVAKGPAASLQAKMSDPRTPNIRMPQFVPEFLAAMKLQSPTPESWAYVPFQDLAKRIEIPDIRLPDAPTATLASSGTPDTPKAGPVASLPVLSPAKIAGTTFGQSNVMVPPPGFKHNPLNPSLVVPPGQPRDLSWVTVMFTVNGADIARAFREAKVPQLILGDTAFLKIEMTREERLPDGSWGRPVVIQPLAGAKILDYPGDKGNPQAEQVYALWAATPSGALEILQPPFYPVNRGDAWAPPGVESAPVAGSAPSSGAPVADFDPARYVNWTPDQLMQLTPEQRRAVAAEKARQEREKNRGNRGGNRGGRGGGGRGEGGGGGGFKGPADDFRDERWFSSDLRTQWMWSFQQGPSDLPRGPVDEFGRPAQGPSSGGMGQEDFGGRGTGDLPPQQQPVVIPTFPMPQGKFDPTSVSEITGWVHDDTVVAGRTYRYRIVYKILSPVYGKPSQTATPELAQVFALVSEPSEWSDAVSLPSLTAFFIASTPSTASGTVRAEVFSWQNGSWISSMVTLSLGDAVYASAGDQQVNSGWTIVDFRTDERNRQYVLVADPDGNLFRRDMASDQASEAYKKLKEQAGAASIATPPPAGG